jgi:arginyl-tRNA synthetase
VLLAQQVTLKRGDEVVSMSKRAGNVITLAEVMDEVGVDAARFFFIDRAPESHLVFDMALAVEHSQKNPVFYVQYGHARIASILRRAADTGKSSLLDRARAGKDLALLTHHSETALMRRLSDFERTVVDAAKDRAPHRVAEYARSVAADFHGFYTDCIVLGEDEAVSSARLSLCMAAKKVLVSSLRLVGVTAPDSM